MTLNGETRVSTAMSRKLTGGPRNVALDDKQKDRALAFMGGLDAFVAIRRDMPVQYVRAFILVAVYEGRGTSFYAEKAGVPKSVMSRHLHDIGDADRLGQEGYGLVVHRRHPTELRAVEIWLTPEGRALWSTIERRVWGAS